MGWVRGPLPRSRPHVGIRCSCSEQAVVYNLKGRMHRRDTTAKDPEELIGDPPAKVVVVASKTVCSQLVAPDHNPLESDCSEGQDNSHNKVSTNDGCQ